MLGFDLLCLAASPLCVARTIALCITLTLLKQLQKPLQPVIMQPVS